MSTKGDERVVKYLYNWYKRQSYITLLFKVRRATNKETDEFILALQKFKQCHAEIINYGVTNQFGEIPQSLVAVSYLVPVTALSFEFYKELREQYISANLSFLKDYSETHDIDVCYTLDSEVYAQFIAHELPFIFNLPHVPTLKSMDGRLELTTQQFEKLYKDWCLNRATSLIGSFPREKKLECVKDSPIFDEAKYAEYTDDFEASKYMHSCFAEKLENWCLDEINTWLKSMTLLD